MTADRGLETAPRGPRFRMTTDERQGLNRRIDDLLARAHRRIELERDVDEPVDHAMQQRDRRVR